MGQKAKGRCLHSQARSNFLQIQGTFLEEVASKLPVIDV